MSDEVPLWLKDDLDEIKTFMRELPDKLDEKFLLRREFAEVRNGIDRRLDDIGMHVTDVGASTKRAWVEIDRLKASSVSRTTVRWVVGTCVALIATAASVAAVLAR